MRSYLTHDLRKDGELAFSHQSMGYLAIVDLDSYPTYVGEKPDYLDMVQHLCAQRDALTATMWEVPDTLLKLKVALAYDRRTVENLEQAGHRIFSTGSVRSSGRLGLVSHQRLATAGRHHGYDLRRGTRTDDARCAHLLTVPPGIYGITVFSGASHHGLNGSALNAEHYSVVLRHHPHPAPRPKPVRLRSLLSSLSSLAPQNLEDVIGMRKMPDYSPST